MAAAGISEGALRDYEQGSRSPSLEAALRLAVAFGEGLILAANHPEMTEGTQKLQKTSRRRRKLDTICALKAELSAIRSARAETSMGADLLIQDTEKRAEKALAACDAARAEATAARHKASQAEEARAVAEKAQVQAEEALAEERRRRGWKTHFGKALRRSNQAPAQR